MTLIINNIIKKAEGPIAVPPIRYRESAPNIIIEACDKQKYATFLALNPSVTVLHYINESQASVYSVPYNGNAVTLGNGIPNPNGNSYVFYEIQRANMREARIPVE